MKDKKKELQDSIDRLNQTAEKIFQTRGYTRQVETLKILEELIREQLTHEHTANTTRQVR